jgi:hypothetical protein
MLAFLYLYVLIVAIAQEEKSFIGWEGEKTLQVCLHVAGSDL